MLSALAAAVAAHQAARSADRIASVAIRVYLAKKIAASTALAEAREFLVPEEFAAWLEQLGLDRRTAEDLLAERWSSLPEQREYLVASLSSLRGRPRVVNGQMSTYRHDPQARDAHPAAGRGGPAGSRRPF
jgi:hypothetical protein